VPRRPVVAPSLDERTPLADPSRPDAEQVNDMAKKDKRRKAEGGSRAATDKKRKSARRGKGGKKVAPVPKGLHNVTPNLVFKDCGQAIDFYKLAFNAKELSRMLAPDGKSVWHAEIRIGDSVLYMNDQSPMSHTMAATAEHRATCALQLYVKDCDAWYERAVEAGARAAMPLADMFWGDRMGGVIDPFGIFWMISTRKQELSAKQLAKAGEEFARQMEEAGQSAPEAAAPAPTSESETPATATAEATTVARSPGGVQEF
jgi:PhnB protein